uniref:WASH complex subunit 4 n=1 Tax=Meloidogyne javanica TaxID=6303 RepID=A0A915MB29_MELJA
METMQHARSRAIVLQDFESLLNDLNSRKDKFIGNNYVKCQGGSDNTFDNISFDLSGDQLTDSITTIFSDILLSANNLIQTSQELFESISMYDEVLDALILTHPFLREHWAVLLRSVRLVQFNPAQFDLEGLSSGRLQHLNALIERLDLVLMNGKILTNTCIKLTRFDQLSSDRQFMERFRLAIMQMLTNWEKHINSSENAIPDKKRLICIHMGEKLNRLLKYILNIHLAEQKPISKANVRQIFVLIQFVKTISNTFTSNWNFILEAINYGCVHLSTSILSILQSIIQLNGESKQPFFANSILNSALSLSQPLGRKALIVAGVSLELANYQKTLRGNDIQIDETLKKLDILCNFGHVLSNSTDLSFLYWHRLSLMQAFCEDLIQEQTTDFLNEDLPRTIIDFFSAINECGRLIISVKHCEQQTFLQTFSNELFSIITNNFLSKLCTEIENDLRLSYHQQQSSSFEQLEKLFSSQNLLQQEEKPLNKLLLNLLQIPKIKLGNRIIVVFDYVTNYLSSTFYNFSVIALHDSEAYNRMRILAKHRYGLNLEDYQLPTRCVDQGLDLITLMSEERMSKFLEDYCYDLDEQFFIERSSQSKQLAIVRVQQIVNSIKTHGIGILDPLINTSYKYMRSQFQLLSRCLSDEKLKSTLIREICFYRDSIDQLEQMYPMERAEKMTNSLKRNMIGLLRMFRSGILETFAPNITFGFKHKELMSDLINNFDKNSIQNNCAKLCDKISSNITGYLTSNNDSIELLTSMFAKEFRGNNKFAHLRDFFILIPTLMSVQIEYITKCRARLSNKMMSLNEDLAVAGSFNEQFIFVEDGFSIGIAYVLTLLNQQFFFNSLNWFDSVFNKIHSEVIKCKNEQKLALKAKDESLARLLALKQSQLNEQLEEFKRLMYSLNSALTFLQANEVCDENIEETYLDDF